MTAVPPSGANEPPPPQRGLTREERGRDVSDAQAEAEAETSKPKQYLRAMSPRFVLSMAEGYPVVLKQFIQFCLIIIYPAWVFTVLVGAAIHALFYITVYPVLCCCFGPFGHTRRSTIPRSTPPTGPSTRKRSS